MARHGQLTIVNLTGEDLKIRAHQHRKGPKEFSVEAGGTTRKTGVRIDRSDFPRNYRRYVEFIDKSTGTRLVKKKYTYKVALLYELILSIDKVSGSYEVRVLSDLPKDALDDLEASYLKELSDIVNNGLDFKSESETEEEDADLEPDIE